MDNRKKYFYLSLAIISILVITTCVTYAFFNYSRNGTTENSITMGDITFIYDEIDKVGRGINLENALPMSDSDAMKLTGEGNAFNFKIKSHTPEGIVIPYIITARKKGDNIGNIIKVSLTEVIDSVTEEEVLPPTYYNALDDFDETVDKVIKIMQVPENSNNYEKNFRLRMWISNKDINGNTVNIGEYSNKEFELKINVESKGRQVAAQEPESDGSFSNSLPKISTTEKGIILAWEYVGEQNITFNHFPDKTDGYVATNTVCNGQPGYFDNDTWSLQVPPITGNTFTCTVTFTDVGPSNYTGLARMILDDNTLIVTPPTLDNTATAAGDTSGLYMSTATNSGNPTYYFRGNVTNNIVDFAGKTWKIIRINEDRSVRMILTTSVTNRFQTDYNIPDYMYYTYKNTLTSNTGMVRLNSWYQTNIVDAGYGNKVATGHYFCEQAKVAGSGFQGTSESSFMTLYSEYTPNFRCAEDNNGYGLVDSPIGLITYDEFVFGGHYVGIADSSNYLSIKSYMATMSPAGTTSNGRSANWYIDGYKLKAYDSDASGGYLVPVINLKSGVTATKDPDTGHYVID